MRRRDEDEDEEVAVAWVAEVAAASAALWGVKRGWRGVEGGRRR